MEWGLGGEVGVGNLFRPHSLTIQMAADYQAILWFKNRLILPAPGILMAFEPALSLLPLDSKLKLRAR